jgi:hypothetical protein
MALRHCQWDENRRSVWPLRMANWLLGTRLNEQSVTPICVCAAASALSVEELACAGQSLRLCQVGEPGVTSAFS